MYVSGKGNKRRSKLCHKFVKRVASINFVISIPVAHVFKSHVLISGGNWKDRNDGKTREKT